MNLYDLKESIQFYEDRYAKGYMEAWDPGKKQRVKEIIQGLNLPDTGQALDFGCGTGIFTAILKEALPHWQVYGTDISAGAIAQARERHPDCTFFVLFDATFQQHKFDFIFTHHVLEHVYNIDNCLKELNIFMKPVSSCLHIVPCGNEGSFEHRVCQLVKDGIDSNCEGRFFFEDEGHIRRLTTKQLCAFLEPYRFKLAQGYYANQFYGAVNWITTLRDHILTLTNYNNAVNFKAKIHLLWLRIWLSSLYFLMQPAKYVKKFKERTNIGIKQFIFFTIALLLYPVSILFYNYLKIKSDREWQMKKNDRNGSEMYLYYKRLN